MRADLVGRTLLGKLRVIRLLGEGGMGSVYEVEHLLTRHHRALKVLHDPFASSGNSIARFVREAGVAGTLRTPHVVESFDAGTLDDGAPYVLMELLEGEALANLLANEGRIAPSRIAGILSQALEGLAVAHKAGVIHRDVKPDNLFLVRDEANGERLKILDFGISKFVAPEGAASPHLTREGTILGTPHYMAPEQAMGAGDVDERADLYAIGVILYQALAGALPFDGPTVAAVIVRVHEGHHTPLEELAPHLPPGLAGLVQKAMARRPDDRFRSAHEMLEALVPFAEGRYVKGLETLRGGGVSPYASTIEGAPVVRVTPTKNATLDAPRPASRRWIALAAVGVAATALAIGIGWAAMLDTDEPRPRETPRRSNPVPEGVATPPPETLQPLQPLQPQPVLELPPEPEPPPPDREQTGPRVRPIRRIELDRDNPYPAPR